MSAIQIQKLTKTFHDLVAVDRVSFEVDFGEITALLGANGAGKSTLLNMIAGIMEPTSGSIAVAGLTYDQHYREIKNKLGYLTADMALYPSLTVREMLLLLGDLKDFDRKYSRRRVDELTSLFGLENYLDKEFKDLSTGQKQRALISSSVFHDPEILIFDEVTASLDIVNAKKIMDFLKSEKEKGKAIIYATHVLSEVEYLSDRILIIEKGHALQDTTYRELMTTPNVSNITEALYGILKKGA